MRHRVPPLLALFLSTVLTCLTFGCGRRSLPAEAVGRVREEDIFDVDVGGYWMALGPHAESVAVAASVGEKLLVVRDGARVGGEYAWIPQMSSERLIVDCVQRRCGGTILPIKPLDGAAPNG